MFKNPIRTPVTSGWKCLMLPVAMLVLAAGVFWAWRHGFAVIAGLLLTSLMALLAWAVFFYYDWPDAEDGLAEDLGLTPPGGDQDAAMPSLDDAGIATRPALEMIGTSFRLQLDLLRASLGLTGIALLWPDAAGSALRLRGLSTRRKDTRLGPYPIGSGITGILENGRDEVAMAPVGPGFHGLPYYRRRGNTGSLFAIRVPGGDGVRGGILCADRQTTDPWDDAELESLRLAARRLAFDITLVRHFLTMHRERGLFQRVSVGLRELTGGLGLDSTVDAAIKAVRTVVDPDLCALMTAEGECYRVLRAEGLLAEKIAGATYSLEEGLVGQALRYDCLLPEGAVHPGPSPVFGPHPLPAGLRSLLILPLHCKNMPPIGGLAVAMRKAGAFTSLAREQLELIAAQVAVKIDLAQAHERINRMATTDGLTGLPNHRAFQQALKTMRQRAHRQLTPLTLVLCDIDHFKEVNDTYGHPFGDLVLREVARELDQNVRDIDLAARYGGEEFALLLENSGGRDGAFVAERARRAVQALEFEREGTRVTVTMSFGLAVFPQHGEEIPALIQRADEALYEAKRQGRNRVVRWEEGVENCPLQPHSQ